jgi:hypothetical protein
LTHLDDAMLLKLIRERELETSQSCESGAVDPHQLGEGCQIQIAGVTTAQGFGQ